MLSAPDHFQLDHQPHRVVTLAFAGDVHFQIQVAALLDDPRGLGPVRRTLSDADVTMASFLVAFTLAEGRAFQISLTRPLEGRASFETLLSQERAMVAALRP